jgi:hypothetical protein
MKFLSRKGQAFVWLEILAAIFVVGLFYVVWSWVLYGQVKALIMPQINTLNSSTLNTTGMQSTINIIDIVWQYWPLIIIFGLILYGIVAAQKREPHEYYA